MFLISDRGLRTFDFGLFYPYLGKAAGIPPSTGKVAPVVGV
ncbi:MAG: hypothetical protein AB1510_02325 [Bacillota bacterium]